MHDFNVDSKVYYMTEDTTDPRYNVEGEIKSLKLNLPVGEGYLVYFPAVNLSFKCQESYLIASTEVNTGLASEPINMPAIVEHLTYTPLSVSFDKPKFLEYALAITQKFKGMLLTEENESEIKSIASSLKKAQTELNSKRIEVEKLISAPIKQLKADVDEVISIFATAQLELKAQLDKAASDRSEEKSKEIQVILEGFLQESTLPEEYKSKVVIKPEYLLAKYTAKKIRDDIKGQLQEQQEYFTNAQKAIELEKLKLQSKELVFNSLKIAFPRLGYLGLADAYEIETEDLAEWFKAKDDVLTATLAAQQKKEETEETLAIPEINFPAKKELGPDAASFPFGTNNVSIPLSQNVKKVENKTVEASKTVLLLRIEGQSEDLVYSVALQAVELVESQGLMIDLVEEN